MSKVVVVGGGASGMMAALFAAQNLHDVILLEKNEKLGKKIYITGKGRCNYSNNADIEDFFTQIVSNPKFLYSALYGFTEPDMTAFLNEEGCRTKAERGGRMFPASDHASDVTAAITRALKSAGVDIRLNTEVKGIITNSSGKDDQYGAQTGAAVSAVGDRKDRVSGVRIDKGVIEADAVILATGGLSYPTTGSDGSGHRMLRELGVTVTETYPALVGLDTAEPFGAHLQGLSLKNVELVLGTGKKPLYREFGELLFTDKGISGPIALSASSRITKRIHSGERISGYIDLKPALDDKTLDSRILREIDAAPNKKVKAIFESLLPGKLASYFPTVCKVDENKRSNELTREERTHIVDTLKHFPLTVTGTGSFKEAIITQGGVSVKEINPSTMEFKRIHGLYCVGELLDVDALTGGYNLQIAFATGVLAGKSV